MRYVVVGGGVAGVCCAEELCRLCPPSDSIALVSVDDVLKGVSVRAKITPRLEHLQVEERRLDEFPHPGFRLLRAVASALDTQGQLLDVREVEADGTLGPTTPVAYDRLCVATGAAPRELDCARGSPDVLTLRDADSVERLLRRLKGARSVIVVGNGGIALEAVHALRSFDVVWATRHGHIGEAFFDRETATFLEEELLRERSLSTASTAASRSRRPTDEDPRGAGGSEESGTRSSTGAERLGHSVGPRWAARVAEGLPGGVGRLEIVRDAEVVGVSRDGLTVGGDGSGGDAGTGAPRSAATPPIVMEFSDGTTRRADVVLAALGVTPMTSWLPTSLTRSDDGALAVDPLMRSSAPQVWAAGDAAYRRPDFSPDAPPQWFGMRLWSAARAGGVLAARGMAAAEPGAVEPGMSFELFAHATSFLGRPVVLLGLYNGQRLESERAEDILAVSRVEEANGAGIADPTLPTDPHPRERGSSGSRSFARAVLLRGRLQGAVLIGDTDLSDTFENLILDKLYVGDVAESLLDPAVDLEGVFD